MLISERVPVGRIHVLGTAKVFAGSSCVLQRLNKLLARKI